jgi:uroporphyrin-III C-methyltransferase
VVCHDALGCADLLAEAKPGAELVHVGKRGYCVGSTRQEAIHDVLVDRARRGLSVVRLKGGDPCVFGRGGEEAEHLAAHGIPFEIVPGVTTAVGACAAAGIPLTHRGSGPAVALVTGHHDPDGPDCKLDWAALAAVGNVVVYMGLRHLGRIAARLVAAGLSADTPAAVIENATLPTQRVTDGTLADISLLAADARSPAVVVVGDCVRHRHALLAAAGALA